MVSTIMKIHFTPRYFFIWLDKDWGVVEKIFFFTDAWKNIITSIAVFKFLCMGEPCSRTYTVATNEASTVMDTLKDTLLYTRRDTHTHATTTDDHTDIIIYVHRHENVNYFLKNSSVLSLTKDFRSIALNFSIFPAPASFLRGRWILHMFRKPTQKRAR